MLFLGRNTPEHGADRRHQLIATLEGLCWLQGKWRERKAQLHALPRMGVCEGGRGHPDCPPGAH